MGALCGFQMFLKVKCVGCTSSWVTNAHLAKS
uniref:Uncharacterized protein n=1 Tax=Rhodnius prolixus TaxID=13249 RepID=T1I2G7_RHOPR